MCSRQSCAEAIMRSFIVVVFILSLLVPAAVGTTKRAAYFLDNNANGSSVISLKISDKTGLLSYEHRIPTGGFGLSAIATRTGAPNSPDGLFGSSCIFSKGDYLFAVNPGSNTLSMFLVDANNPWKPKLIGKPVDTFGLFPMSVTYSSILNTACVLNGGAVAGVACYSVDDSNGLLPTITALRSIPSFNQSMPPLGPFGTTSQILFNPSSTALFVLVKGTSTTTPGSILVWPVVNGAVSFTPIVTFLPSVPLPFSATFLGTDSRILIADVTFGGSIVDVFPSLTLAVEDLITVFKEGADCWTAWYPKTHSGFILDGGQPNITIIDTDTGAITGSVIGLDPARMAVLDSAIDRTHMYTLAGDPAVIAIDLEAGVPFVVQNLDLSSIGSRFGWQGMTTYPS